MKFYTEIATETETTTFNFTAKQIIAHKMPKIDSDKWETRKMNIGGKFTTVYSRNNGSYFIMNGMNYYVADNMFKNFKSVKRVKPVVKKVEKTEK
jgi:hypothetical protein